MSIADDFPPRALSREQEVQLREMTAVVAGERSPRARRQRVVNRLAAVLQAPVALVACRGDAWTTLADSGLDRPLPAAADGVWDVLLSCLRADAASRQPLVVRGMVWTVIPLGGPLRSASGGAAMLLRGNWSASLGSLDTALRQVVRSARLRIGERTGVTAMVHRLGRELGWAQNAEDVGEVVLRHVVRAVPSRFAAFAVATPAGDLQIVATHGYPVTLVKDVRIDAGPSVMGTVLQRRAPLCVADVAQRPGLQRRRPRYRTNSFLALPVLAANTVAGVLCVTDRLDDQPFDREDASALRALMGPTGLALMRVHAEMQANMFARAATIDPVSGLFNRRYFHARLEEELERSVRQQTSVSLLMIDVDDFKQINDRFGHPAGDMVIRDISEILRRSVRLFDICTRFGGEEFAVLMPAAGAVNAGRVAERIRERIERYRPADPAAPTFSVTVSIGLAVATSRSAQGLIDAADRALYEAKAQGKNRVVQTTVPESPQSWQNSLSPQTFRGQPPNKSPRRE